MMPTLSELAAAYRYDFPEDSVAAQMVYWTALYKNVERACARQRRRAARLPLLLCRQRYYAEAETDDEGAGAVTGSGYGAPYGSGPGSGAGAATSYGPGAATGYGPGSGSGPGPGAATGYGSGADEARAPTDVVVALARPGLDGAFRHMVTFL